MPWAHPVVFISHVPGKGSASELHPSPLQYPCRLPALEEVGNLLTGGVLLSIPLWGAMESMV